MNENFDESTLQSELGASLGEAVRSVRNSNPDADRVQSSVSAMEMLIEDRELSTLNQNHHSSNGLNLSTRLSWIGIFVLAGLLTMGAVLWLSVPQEVTAAQVARSMAAQDWVRATETSSEGGKRESWFSASRNISAISDGERIEYRNHDSGESYEFFHESQTIFLVSESETPRPHSHWSNLATCLPALLDDGLPHDPMNNLPGLSELKDRVEFLGHSIEPSSEDNQLEYAIQCLLDKNPFEIVFFVDARTHLPARCIMTGVRQGKEVCNTIELSYPSDGPESIYSLGVPKNAKLVNRSDSGMGKALRNAVRAGAENFDDYRAVMVKHRVGDKLWWVNARVEIVCCKGDRFTRRHVSRFERTRKEPREGVDLHAWWERQVSLAHGGPDGTPYNIVIGKDIWDFRDKTFVKRLHGDNGYHCFSLRPDMIARPPMGGSSAQLEIRVDENPKSGPPGTILYELIGSNNDSVTRNWIDPNQGHLVVKSEMGSAEQWDRQNIVEKAAQSPSGIWYPVLLRSYWHDSEGNLHEDETNCYLDFESEISDELFEVK